MTSNFYILLKFQLKYKLGISRIKEILSGSASKKISFAGGVMLITLLALVIMVPYTVMMNLMYGMFSDANNIGGYFTFVTLIASLALFMLSLLSVYSIMFATKDRDILTPLPIKKKHIFLVNYILMFMTAIVSSTCLLLPGFIVYFINAGFSVVMLLKMILGIITFPAFSLGLAYFIMSIVLRVATFFRYKDVIVTIGGILVFIAALFVNRINILGEIFNQSKTFEVFSRFIVNSFFLNKSLLSDGTTSLLFTAAEVAVGTVLFVAVYIYGGMTYDKITEKIGSSSKQNSKKKNKYTQRKQADAFCKKEILTLIRCPVYVLNCLLNIIFAPLAAFLLYKQSANLSEATILKDNMFFVGIAMSFFIMSLSMVPSTSISREGKSFWVTQMVPVSQKEQMKGRVKASVILYWIASFLYIILFGVLLKFDFLYIIYGLMVSFAGAIPFAYAGLLIDYIKPKLQWDKESEAAKQNFNAVLGIIISVVFSIIYCIPIIVFIAGAITETVALIAMPVVILICILLMRYIFYKRCRD